MMNQQDIKEELIQIKSRLNTVRMQEDLIKVELKWLQRKCDHPEKYQYSAMGELGWYCPDCEWQT